MRKRLAPSAVTAALAVLGVCAGGAQAATWVPPQHLTWYWQLTGNINNSYAPKTAAAYDIDLFDDANYTDYDGTGNSQSGQTEISTLHGLGDRVICYVDVGTWENWRPDASLFPSALLGNNNGWPGEKWLNVSPSGPDYATLQTLMSERFALAAANGCDAIEPDNMDSAESGNNPGFPTTTAQQLAYDEWVAKAVHSYGMAVFQKNYIEESNALEPYFDGLLDEECNYYDECSDGSVYLTAGKPFLNAEYTSDGETTSMFCSADNNAGIMGALYDLNLDGATYGPCWPASTTTPPPVTTTPPPPVTTTPPPVTTPTTPTTPVTTPTGGSGSGSGSGSGGGSGTPPPHSKVKKSSKPGRSSRQTAKAPRKTGRRSSQRGCGVARGRHRSQHRSRCKPVRALRGSRGTR